MGLTPPTPSSAEVLEKSRAIPLLSLRAFVAYKKGETFLDVFEAVDNAESNGV